jgi:hypothetical protein
MDKINTLEELSIIAGAGLVYTNTISTTARVPINIYEDIFSILISHFDDTSYVILQKDVQITGTPPVYSFSITVSREETNLIAGKYLYQIVRYIPSSGYVYKLGQGILTIVK